MSFYSMQYGPATWSVAPVIPSATRNLVLVHRPGAIDIADLQCIRELVHERAPDIEVFIAHSRSPCSVTARQAARRPSLVFSPASFRKFVPRGGKVYRPISIGKLEQARRLQAAGIAVPETIAFDSQTVLDPARWGPLTVVKPDRSGSGKDVEVWRTRELHGKRPLWPENDHRRDKAMVAQKFIDTGRHPAKYRLLALFGRPIYCEKQASIEPSPAFDFEGTGAIGGLVTTSASSEATAGTRRNTVCNDEDVLSLAPPVASIFPEAAALGLDILREASSGKLYILEINCEGFAWHLSSWLGKIAQRRQNINRYAQFDALSVVANALIEKTRAEAE
ncbi:MAG TPA: hypothetical protein VFY21_14005 [Xanthobacteraceae bacterium]|nr:hypothetical protein [Xanthobacteraceae bacterium]